MRTAFAMCRTTAFTGDVTLSVFVHRRKTARAGAIAFSRCLHRRILCTNGERDGHCGYDLPIERARA